MQADDGVKILQEAIGYTFADGRLLIEALTHKSYSNEQPAGSTPCNERLEFLGDAVLDLVVSRYVFVRYPQAQEGELTRIRAEVVSEKGLAVVARRLRLGDFLLLGRGEERSGGREKESLIANALEALLGAVFCDGGFEAARLLAEELFTGQLDKAGRRKQSIDHKTRLQELSQARYAVAPEYIVVCEEGPEHRRQYTIEVSLAGKALGRGQGSTKKKAEQQAALRAIGILEQEG